jgi:DNA replication protein DnaC
MARIGVPRRHIENFSGRCESYAVSEALKCSVKGFLVLCGRNGSGKSFAAARAVYAYLESRVINRLDRETWESVDRAGDSVMWRSAREIVDDRETYERAGIVSLLVIDDLGREGDMKPARTAVCSAVSKRYDSKLATIVTTELSMTDISRRYGRYLSDRLVEDAGIGGGVVDCRDVSVRNALNV